MGPVFLDWSDATVTHPFLAAASFLDDPAGVPADLRQRPRGGLPRRLDRLRRPAPTATRALELARIVHPLHMAQLHADRILPGLDQPWELAWSVPVLTPVAAAASCDIAAYPRTVTTRTHIPEDVLTAAHDRARARADRDWPEADRLRGVIEAAGWKIVDRGTDFALTPAVPADLEDGGRIRYGASQHVPSRLEEPAVGLATIVLLATDHPDDLERAVRAFASHAPAGTSVVIVADAPSEDQAAALDALAPSAAGRHGRDAARGDLDERTAGPRRRDEHRDPPVPGSGRDPARYERGADRGLRDAARPAPWTIRPSAVVGGWGITSGDLRRFEDAPAGDVDAIEGYCQAFRRADYVERGPLDERFRFYRNLDIWWSLVLRDGGEGEPSRRAVRLDGLPLARHDHRGWTSLPDDERDRQSKRNFYRIIDRFGWRRDLLIHPAETR